MTESYERDRARERVRFDVFPDGTVEGDDRYGGNFAATLRYACRMGSQIGALLGLGELERLGTLSSLAVMARVAGVAPDLSIRAQVEFLEMPPPEPVAAMAVGNVRDAIDRALRRVTLDFACDWTALITDQGQLVGVIHDEAMGTGIPESVDEVGVRVLAVIGALDEVLRKTAVRLDFVRGSVLVVAIGQHAIYAQADKFDASEVGRTVAAVQTLLAGVGLQRAGGVTASRRAG